MPVETTEDRASFFDPDEWGDRVTWHGGEFYGQFNNEHYLADPGAGVLVATSQPAIVCNGDDIRGLDDGDELTVYSGQADPRAVNAPASRDFVVVNVEDDGTGIATIILTDRLA